MIVRHLQDDTPRRPHRVSPDERVELVVATDPVGPHQWVWIDYREWDPDRECSLPSEPTNEGCSPARWLRNGGGSSYWQAFVGPFRAGTRVTYNAWATSPEGDATSPEASFRVATRLHVALMWHQHQPFYRDPDVPVGRGSFRQPWVRLHGIRDYYAMAALVAQHPDVHLTINLTPVLLMQVEDYLERGATDRALELTLTPAEELTGEQREELLGTFFDADWHHQVYPHRRYSDLLERRLAGRRFAVQDLRDLQMWFNLAWFAPEFRGDDVALATGESASVRRYVEQGHGFDADDVRGMVAEQYKILRAIVPLHRELQDRGQIEVATSAYYHPILPLLMDTDQATLDRPGTTLPPRFTHPEDARAHIAHAVDHYRRLFGRIPRGMWPAEGAISQDAAALFAEAGVRWIASDAGVLQRSGRWGYRIDDPNVLCQPYRVETPNGDVSIFFRDPGLSDDIGFHYQHYGDAEAAAQDFIRQIRERFARRLGGDHERVLTVILDGENAWSAYPNDARPFLHALYRELEQARDLATVTFGECLDGNPDRSLDG
ncbi:MAG: glycoside hydrolase family 57 protein, partial [Trueperaceae bacterium]